MLSLKLTKVRGEFIKEAKSLQVKKSLTKPLY